MQLELVKTFGVLEEIFEPIDQLRLAVYIYIYSISQWLNFKLFGITYLVGKIKFKLFFSGSTG